MTLNFLIIKYIATTKKTVKWYLIGQEKKDLNPQLMVLKTIVLPLNYSP